VKEKNNYLSGEIFGLFSSLSIIKIYNYTRGHIMNRKEVKSMIKDLHVQSKTKNEIYAHLISLVKESDKTWLSRQIASQIDQSKVTSNLIPIKLLVTSLFIQCITIIIKAVQSFITNNHLDSSIIFVVSIIIGISLVIGILKNNLFCYGVLITLNELSIIFVAIQVLFRKYPLEYLLYIPYYFIYIIFIYLLRRQLFPEVNLWGNVNKNNNQEYIF